MIGETTCASTARDTEPAVYWPRRQRLGSETILLVEDEDAVRAVASRILASHGYRVLTAATAEEALAVFEAKAPRIKLLLTDVTMPRMSGVELAVRLRDAGFESGVLYMSGFTADGMPKRAGFGGDLRLVQKPFTSSQLLGAVREVLDATAGNTTRELQPA